MEYTTKVIQKAVEFSCGTTIRVSKTKSGDDKDKLTAEGFEISIESGDSGHDVAVSIHFPMKEEVLELAEAIKEIAEQFESYDD